MIHVETHFLASLWNHKAFYYNLMGFVASDLRSFSRDFLSVSIYLENDAWSQKLDHSVVYVFTFHSYDFNTFHFSVSKL